MAKCKNCRNFDRAITSDNEYICNWCEKIKDNPHEEIERECEHYVVMTNADRIRSMTDEELAELLLCNCCESMGMEHCPHDDEFLSAKDLKNSCSNCVMKWLKSEVGCE